MSTSLDPGLHHGAPESSPGDSVPSQHFASEQRQVIWEWVSGFTWIHTQTHTHKYTHCLKGKTGEHDLKLEKGQDAGSGVGVTKQKGKE